MGRQWHCERSLKLCSKNQRRRLRPAHGHPWPWQLRHTSRRTNSTSSRRSDSPAAPDARSQQTPNNSKQRGTTSRHGPRHGKLLTFRPPPSWSAASAKRLARPGQAPGPSPAPAPLQKWAGGARASSIGWARCTHQPAADMHTAKLRMQQTCLIQKCTRLLNCQANPPSPAARTCA